MGCFNIQLFMSWLFQFCTVSQGFQTHIPWLIHCLMYTLPVCGLLICWECSRENTGGFLPFVFASYITQFTYKYGLSCPFSMPEPQTNLPLALIWKMSLLSQGNRIILIDGKRQNHICLDKKKGSRMRRWQPEYSLGRMQEAQSFYCRDLKIVLYKAEQEVLACRWDGLCAPIKVPCVLTSLLFSLWSLLLPVP